MKYTDIKKLTAGVGGYFGNSYSVTIDFYSNQVEWSCSVRGLMLDSKEHKMQSKTKEKLVERLESTHLLNWKERYVEPILDGTSWGIEIEFQDRVVEKNGENGFPNEWDDFCKVMSWVARGAFY